MSDSDYRVKPGKKVKLHKYDTADTGPFKKREEAEEAIEKNLKKLAELQDVLYGENRHALLIVLQALDAGGKDGAIKHVFSGVNPQGCSVHSFKVPTELEKSHDFLWRIHEACPRKGMIGIFNRSHYESVLVERVHNLVPKKVWSGRYDRINSFERLLSEEGTTIVKFFLHISKDEQKKRMEARLEDPQKNWKFEPSDLREREYWDEYVDAFEDALSKCSTSYAPWHIVPADHKWFRNWVVSDTIVRTLQGLHMEYPKPVPGLEKVVVK